LAQADDSSLQELVELGASIRQSMASGDDTATRSLLRGRAAALATTLRRAKETARVHGESVSAAVADQIARSLRAATADDDAAASARSGMLTDALDEPGFEAVEIEPTTATSPPRLATRRSPPESKEPAGARKNDDVAADRAGAESRRAATAAAKVAARERAEHDKALADATERRNGLAREHDRVAALLAEIDDQLSHAQAEAEEVALRVRDAFTD
ncbi:MAG: hypothetical protein ABIO83_03145, partial [Ilumatobacteraceae bacterium]